MPTLPEFKYHPNPLETGSIKESDNNCRCCCEQKRGFMYVGSVYAIEDLDDCICPWCIADGSAADKFDASFADDLNLIKAGVSLEIIHEVTGRNPGYISWQAEYWEAHCEDACEFHGDPT